MVTCDVRHVGHLVIMLITYDKNMRDSETIDELLDNSLAVIADFIELVSTYGSIGCINHVAPHDRRFKLTRNGSYYELCGYTFCYGFMHDTDDIWWTCANFDAHVLVKGERRVTKGDLVVRMYLGETFI